MTGGHVLRGVFRRQRRRPCWPPVVAHRLTQARECDQIAVMAHGRIVEQGSHDELVAAGGTYARLWSAWSH